MRNNEESHLDVSEAKEPKCSDSRKERTLPPADAKRTRSEPPPAREREERGVTGRPGSNSEV